MITLKVKELKSWKDRIIGLIGRDKPIHLILYTRFGIHTFGLKFPIDVIILDKSHRVVKTKKDLKPNSLYFWNLRYYKVLELPVGLINKNRIKIGDHIRLKIM